MSTTAGLHSTFFAKRPSCSHSIVAVRIQFPPLLHVSVKQELETADPSLCTMQPWFAKLHGKDRVERLGRQYRGCEIRSNACCKANASSSTGYSNLFDLKAAYLSWQAWRLLLIGYMYFLANSLCTVVGQHSGHCVERWAEIKHLFT